MDNKNQIIAYIGFALKSKNVAVGTDDILRCNPQKIFSILITSSLGENSRNKLINFADKNDIPIFFSENETLCEYNLDESIKAIAITDFNLATAFNRVAKTNFKLGGKSN